MFIISQKLRHIQVIKKTVFVRTPDLQSNLPKRPQSAANDDKGDDAMIPGTVHKSPGIYLTAEENV